MKKLTVILYCIFLLLFAIFSYVFIDPNLSYLKNIYSGFAFSNRSLTTIFYIFSIIIFFIFYGVFIYWGLRKKINLKEIFILLIITAGILLFSYPAMLSYDIFNYIATSKVLFFYHENPYIVMPIEFIGDPLLAFIHAANKIALYGPFWILLTGIPHVLGFENFIITLFGFKLFSAVFYLGTAFLIWKISKDIMPLILFALNPLVIMETLVSGHNDIVMIFFILFSYFLLAKKKVFFAILFFILSILIKYATILLLPVFLYTFWKLAIKKEINWNTIFYFSSLLMFVGFLLSPVREEIYSWYAIWFLPFAFLVPEKKTPLYVSISLSFGLLFRYVPYMLFGTYAGLTPAIKLIATFLPSFLVGFYLIIKKKIWESSYQ